MNRWKQVETYTLGIIAVVSIIYAVADALNLLEWPGIARRIPQITLFLLAAMTLHLVATQIKLQQSISRVTQTIEQACPLRLLGPRSNMTGLYTDLFQSAQAKIDIISLTAETAIQAYGEKMFLDKIMESKCQIRIMFLDPLSELWDYRLQAESDNPEAAKRQMQSHIEQSKAFFQGIEAKVNKLQKKSGGSREGELCVKQHDTIPHFAYFRADDTIIVGFYYSYVVGLKAHAIEVPSTSELFQPLERHFENIWRKENGPPVADVTFWS